MSEIPVSPAVSAEVAESPSPAPAPNPSLTDDEEVDNDDMDYEPTTDADDDDDLADMIYSIDQYADSEHLGGLELDFSIGEQGEEEEEDDDDDDDGNDTETEGTGEGHAGAGPPLISRQDLLQLLGGQRGLGRLFVQHVGAQPGMLLNDHDDGDDTYGDGDDRWMPGALRSRRARKHRAPIRYPKVPSDKGTELMASGDFGRMDARVRPKSRRKESVALRLLRRELGVDGTPEKVGNHLLAQEMIPSSYPDTIIHYDSRVYSGQFSDDGNFFFSCGQDFKVRMYDTSNPYEWKYYKTVQYYGGQWTITDASLSPDNKYLAYSSIRSLVALAPTDPNDDSDPYVLDFANLNRPGGGRGRGAGGAGDFSGRGDFGIWSIRFSGDGREIVAGTGDHCVYVYDIETRQSILRIHGHEDDVNAVCFGDTLSPHILYSGSDDATLKVWDRRSMGDGREAGAFLGHTQGVTYIDSKGDGRYVLSNSKDQSMKLWDLRRMISSDRFDKIDRTDLVGQSFDYRFMPYDDSLYRVHPHDCSLVSYRGHSVLKTLIRCHFSPPGSSNSRYLYTGSADGTVFIYNLDATVAGSIDVRKATDKSRPRASMPRGHHAYNHSRSGVWETCVRDVSWHPNAPVLAATAWNGWGSATGSVTVHCWNDGADDDDAEPGMGTRLDATLRQDPDEEVQFEWDRVEDIGRRARWRRENMRN